MLIPVKRKTKKYRPFTALSGKKAISLSYHPNIFSVKIPTYSFQNGKS